ncbi:MAG TPA: nucleotide disphospho-sugar-binding domain-containing protein [Longimicrobiaceae bacterium]|nr:nucleotide disphospho-sugar-binding domain-containing protein [Longimicrobiaceae bacterium]
MSRTSAAVPRRYLFVLWEGGGNVPPQLTLARKLLQRGHRVRVLADPCIREDAEAAGCTFVPFTRAPHRHDRTVESDIIRDWEARTPLQAFARLRDRIMFGPALRYAEDVLEELGREAADVVAVDYTLLGAASGAERAGVPVALMVHTVYQFPSPGMPAPGPGFLPMGGPLGRVRDALFGRLFLRVFATGLPVLNQARAALGLEPLRDLWQAIEGADRALVLTSRAFDYEAAALPANVRYVGPQVEDPAWTGPWESPWPSDHPDPLVVVSLSTTPQGQAGLLQRVVDALAGMPVRALVTTGPAVDPESIRAAANVVVRRSAPHARVFREASAVVTHAGHGTVIRALAAGVPLLCLPMGRDQPDIAARVVHRGAGVRLSPRAGVPALRKALVRVLEEPGFRERAAAISRTIAEEVRRDDAVGELEALASRSAAA